MTKNPFQARLHCIQCSARFSTVWERRMHERRDHAARSSNAMTPPIKESAPMSDLSAEKVVAELRDALQAAEFGKAHGTLVGPAHYAAFIAPMRRAADLITHQAARLEEVTGALDRLVNAKAIGGVRELVAGWNGEGRPDGPYPRHDNRLGATLPKTNCGQIYELDDAMQAARAALSEKETGDVAR